MFKLQKNNCTFIDKVLQMTISTLTCKAPNTTIAEFANTVDPDEKAHNEPSHLDLQYLPASLYIVIFLKICRHNFVVCLFGAL